MLRKYLTMDCSLERVAVADGKPILNVYGELTYSAPETIKCRRELYVREIQTFAGAIVKSSSEYYTLEAIGINDKLDGKVVLTVEEYRSGSGKLFGYRSVV